MVKSSRGVVLLLVACSFAGCERVKSSNPLSPAIAGPIAGVEITTPTALEPVNGQGITDRDQPVVLVIGNASSNSVRQYSFRVEIAADSGFGTILVKREGVPQGAGSSTSMTLTDRLQPNRSYFWRVQADDGANKSEWSSVRSFFIRENVVLGTPEPRSPINNVRLSSASPELRVGNGQSTGPFTQLYYQFQVADNPNFAPTVTDIAVVEGSGGETRYTPLPVPKTDTTYYWRVRIYDATNVGQWSRVESFLSAPVSAPPPPSPGQPPAPPGSCASSNGQAIVSCIGAKYPERLVAGISLSQRQDNMAFIRDRIIEAGKCGGLDLGWNLKRGGPELSIDFLAWRTGGENIGVDLAFDYDNTSMPLRLTWAEHGPGAFYAAYPNVPCN